MRYLIDTHVYIWMLIDDDKLSTKVRSILTNQAHVFFSVVGLWEISIKYGLGKLELDGATPQSLFRASKDMGIKTLSLTEQDAASFHFLERQHKDAFDRMIVWQTINNGLVLLSKDGIMREYEKFGLKLIW